MIDLSKIRNKKYPYREAAFVLGLGKSGYSAAVALVKNGWTVYVWDDHEKSRVEAEKKADWEKIRFIFQNPAENPEKFFSQIGMVIPSPGISLSHSLIQSAQRQGCLILGDIELFALAELDCRTIGVTGTNGKSTTTALIHHILKSAGRPSVMGGNIGIPVLDLEIKDRPFVVLELSSYQLDLCPAFRPEISVLLNITPDHIERHGSLENYAASKARIFEGPGVAIIGMDDALSRDIAEDVKNKNQRHVIPIRHDDKIAEELKRNMLLKGDHNLQNALAAYHTCKTAGLNHEEIIAGLRTFSGLPHRQFPVRIIDNVTYINDSKATNAEAASKALASYDNIYWIAGGRAKEGGLNGLEPLMASVREAYLIGEAANDFSGWMKKNNVPHRISKTLDIAVREASKAARKNPPAVVLLSPACASWDQFSSYEERGDVFTGLVSALAESAAA